MSDQSVREHVLYLLKDGGAHLGFEQAIAFPLIGAGSGSFDQEKAKTIQLGELQKLESSMEAFLVEFCNH